ncbi:MAG: hypothetical protein LUE26_09730 [Alistipes sp.]|nr:hypothetical protein [Alistipes sp.]
MGRGVCDNGEKELGFDFPGTPFGEDDFDCWYENHGEHVYQDVFNGYVFYRPIDEWILSTGVDGLMEEGHLEETLNWVRTANRGKIDEEFFREIYGQLNTRQEIPFREQKDYLREEKFYGMRDKWLQ